MLLVMPCAPSLARTSKGEYSSTDPQGHLLQSQCHRLSEPAASSRWINQESDRAADRCLPLLNAYPR
jgi:hypothetical protein